MEQKRSAKYQIAQSQIGFEVFLKQRMPKAFGGEEYVYVRRITESGNGSDFLIDHNGRFLDQLKIDASHDGRWARVYLDLPVPLVGESVPFKTNEFGELSYVFKNYLTGQTSVSNVYSHNIIAYIDFEAGVVINAYRTNSTVEERNSKLIGLNIAMPAKQRLRDLMIDWQHVALKGGKTGSVLTNDIK